ncbi:ATP-binding cassette domain-containing protein [Sinirhodobacter ferrireducens]|uniref:ATP-binding cassette domain-containing protein n=1 Tax=Paenirhodobacter ferrireducens TaxID=1215032 RepID=A0A443LBH5_9RHOB|nr:ATP-binding cassette domain-containing protein [Sinirhodobacter ferrireducens]RWR46512.1 ATP-binding cassette domain-containing protein [Sinirhodobacter ferrireducens]
MPQTDEPTAANPGRADAALTRLAAPAAPALGRAGALSALAELLWAAQAALVALALGGLISGTERLSPLAAAAGFLALAALRALLEARAGALAQRAATALVESTRHRLIGAAARQDARARSPAPAELASLAAEKVAMLAPWAARYSPAMARVRIVPLVLLALTLPFSWAAALVLLVAGPLIPVFMALVGMAARDASERQMAEIGTLNTLLVDRIAAVADLRLLGAEARAGADLAAASDDLRTRTMRVLAVAFLSSTVLELFSALGVAMVAVYVGFALLGELTFGSWGGLSPEAGIFLLMIAPEFFQPLRDLAAAWHDRASALAVAGEIEAAEAAIAASGTLLGQGAPAAALPPAPFRWHGLVLSPGPGAALLGPPDGAVQPGEALAIAGPSGVGKTTLLAALAGLIRPEAGEIRWGETVLSDSTADAIRAGIGWLPQAPRFIDAPLGEALMLGRTGDLDAALTAAQAQGIVAALPGGLSTRLGDLGGGVSGGEARRLMIARAHAAKASLILADEPTADLDPETAQAVLTGLLALRATGAALIVASHDPAVLGAMDRVLPMTPEGRA